MRRLLFDIPLNTVKRVPRMTPPSNTTNISNRRALPWNNGRRGSSLLLVALEVLLEQREIERWYNPSTATPLQMACQ